MNQKFMERHQVEAKAEEQRKKGRKAVNRKIRQCAREIKKKWLSGVVSRANPKLAPFFLTQ